MTLTEATKTVSELLAMADGDADAVCRALTRGARASRQFAGHTEECDESTAMLLLALSDLTGNASYRYGAPA